jgi:hypothetical protein
VDSTQTKSQKIAVAAQKMSLSPAFGEVLKLSPEQWAAYLSRLDESAVEDCLLLLKEEADTDREVEEKRHRRHEANKKKLLSRLPQ